MREKLHTVTSVHSEEHAAVVPAATVEEEDKEEGHVTAPNPANDKKEEEEEATTPVENGVKTEEKSEKDHGNDHASVGEDAKEGNEQAKAAKKTEMPGNQGKTVRTVSLLLPLLSLSFSPFPSATQRRLRGSRDED